MQSNNSDNGQVASSFRDPSGFVFRRNGEIYRQVNRFCQEDYDFLLSSGLYEKLVSRKMLLPHQEVEISPENPTLHYRTIQPVAVPFISYPYEWSYSQYRDAALQTLRIQKEALQHGMILKDASAYNIQFVRNHPLMIDTLSLTRYIEGSPWVAYRQFCQHFLAPLALMSKVDVHLAQLMVTNLDGIPLVLASRLLPFRTRLNFGLATHIHLHAQASRKFTQKENSTSGKTSSFSKNSLIGLIDSLANTVWGLKWKPEGENWADYYQETNYNEAAFLVKKEIVADLLKRLQPKLVWDFGANTGVFSRLAQDIDGCLVISSDYDPEAVEQNYLDSKKNKVTNNHPLVLDLANPSPAIGWGNEERNSFFQRGPADVILALALIHHLAISNNLPLRKISNTLAAHGKHLIIEFVPKEDSQVQRLLSARDDIFPDYHRQGFLDAFQQDFDLREEIEITGSERSIYWFSRK